MVCQAAASWVPLRKGFPASTSDSCPDGSQRALCGQGWRAWEGCVAGNPGVTSICLQAFCSHFLLRTGNGKRGLYAFTFSPAVLIFLPEISSSSCSPQLRGKRVLSRREAALGAALSFFLSSVGKEPRLSRKGAPPSWVSSGGSWVIKLWPVLRLWLASLAFWLSVCRNLEHTVWKQTDLEKREMNVWLSPVWKSPRSLWIRCQLLLLV